MQESAYPSGSSGHGWTGAIEASFGMIDDGLVCDRDLILVKMTKRAGEHGHLALDEDYDRVVALLSVASGRPIAHDEVLPAIEAASDYWRRGDKALANLRLIFSGLPRLASTKDIRRVRLADDVLDHGSHQTP